MSINIPSYYYTDIYKHVKGESIKSINAKIAKGNPNFVHDLQNGRPKLNTLKAIDLSTKEGQASVHLSDEEKKNIEEAKKKLRNVKIDFDEIENRTPELKVIVKNKNGEPLAYYDFENCINNMSELSDKQKETLANAIITSTESLQGQQQDSNTFGMHISQTQMELKYISEKLVPEKYREEFNSISDKYVNNETDKYTKILETFETAIMNSTDPALIQAGWREKAKQSLDELKNGTDDFHTTKRYYDELYRNIDLTNDDKIKDQLSSVYNKFLAKGEYDGDARVREVKYLSEKWNAVIDSMKGSSNLKFTTALNSLA
ncbi:MULTISPECIES: hypothetical protein [Clostridium]|uniref:Uncharacterized protein n=1 Tax=Clostridium cibarium TaxID=2762247 RepID=A0ABR8PYV5_9CLOT|nr:MULTISPECIES: hypothetical protein [Clostridium]MBD7913349.1 hypothetical protein [Clostridium cibarium]